MLPFAFFTGVVVLVVLYCVWQWREIRDEDCRNDPY